MRVRYLGETSPLELTQGKVYDMLSVERDWYRVIDDTNEDYLYPPEDFEVVEPEDGTIHCVLKASCDRLAQPDLAPA